MSVIAASTPSNATILSFSISSLILSFSISEEDISVELHFEDQHRRYVAKRIQTILVLPFGL